MSGKGDGQRPKEITDEELAANWHRVFSGPKPKNDVRDSRIANEKETIAKDDD